MTSGFKTRYARMMIRVGLRREGTALYCSARDQRKTEHAELRADIRRAIEECQSRGWLPAVSLVPIYFSFCWQRFKLRIKPQVVADRDCRALEHFSVSWARVVHKNSNLGPAD
jgi:hypothetical protein